MGPQHSMIMAATASGVWNPYARLVMVRTLRLRPSVRPLMMPSSSAARIPSRCLRIVRASLTKGSSRDRWAQETKRSSSRVASATDRSGSKIARSASLSW